MYAGSAAVTTCLCERTRYRRGPPMVRNMRAVLKKVSWGTRRIFGSIRCKKQASTVRKRYSVRKTASCGTRSVFKTFCDKKGLLGYATHLQRPTEQQTPQTVDSLLPHRTHFQRRAVPKAAPAALDASSVRETAPAIGANYDEFIANPYLNYPDPLVTFDRFVVTK